MKKPFPVYFDDSVLNLDKMTVSAGMKGCQLLIDRKALIDFTKAEVCSLT